MFKNLSLNTFLNKFGTLIAICLLLVMFCLQISSARLECQIIDEGAHLTAGYSYLQNKKIELNPEHPPLVKLLSAVFISPQKPNFYDTNLKEQNQWNTATKFFYASDNNAENLLFWGRIPTMLLGLLLGWLIFVFTRQIADVKTALIALILYVFDPNILAHSRYITTDIPIALGFLACLYFLYKYLEKPTKKYLFLFTLVFALAQVTKFSALLLLPLVLAFGFFAKIKAKNYLFLIISLIFSTSIIIILFYFGHPLAYLEGIQDLFDHEKGGHYSYLLGNFDDHGFWYYFPIAFLVKTPLSIILLLCLAIPLFVHDVRSRLVTAHKNVSLFKKNLNFFKHITLLEWTLIFFPAYYFLASIINRLNIGVRHIIPIYPFIFIFISLYVFKKRKIAWPKILACFLILFFVVESLIIYPNYTSYFSLLIGGSNQGDKYLLDSNNDWGQDLLKLKKYLDENNITEKIYLSYFGKAAPSYYNINYAPIEKLESRYQDKDYWIAVSAYNRLLPDFPHKWLLSEEPVIKIGGSIYLYHMQ